MKKIAIILSLLLSLPLFQSCEVTGDPEMLELMLQIKNQNEELLTEVKNLQSKSDSLINELKSSAAKQEELLAKVNSLQTELASILTQINLLTEQLNSQDADIELIKSQLADLQEKYQAILIQLEELQKLSQILAEIEILKGQLSDLDDSYQSILDSLSKNHEEFQALKNQIDALQNQLNEYFSSISELTSQLGQQGANISNILSQLTELSKSIEEIKNQLNTLLENGGVGGGDNGDVPSFGTVEDIEGNVYRTVKIGNQIWMAENLRVSKFSNGDPIPTYQDRFIWEWGFPQNSPDLKYELRTTPAYCFYNNDSGVNEVYGKLYNWYVSTDSRNVCPEGWRVSTDQDWTILQDFLGENPGGKLKKTGTDEWNFPNTGATDEFGFSAVPSGARVNEGFFSDIGIGAGFWSPSSSIAYFRFITVNNETIGRTTRSKTNGLCIRCIKN